MITERTVIEEVPTKIREWAIRVAERTYDKWNIESGANVPFEEDVRYYLLNGFVVSRPTCFGMAKIIDGENGDPCWFVRMAAGDLCELLSALPGYLPRIAFCRRNDPRVREYSTERVVRLALARERNGGN